MPERCRGAGSTALTEEMFEIAFGIRMQKLQEHKCTFRRNTDGRVLRCRRTPTRHAQPNPMHPTRPASLPSLDATVFCLACWR